MSDAMLKDANKAAGALKEDATVAMRLAMGIGLEFLRRCNYDVSGAVIDKVRGRRKKRRVVKAR